MSGSVYGNDGLYSPDQVISGGASNTPKTERDISSQADGSNTTFTIPDAFHSNSIELYYNGLKQRKPNEFTVTNSTTIETTFTPYGAPSVLVVAYYPTT